MSFPHIIANDAEAGSELPWLAIALLISSGLLAIAIVLLVGFRRLSRRLTQRIREQLSHEAALEARYRDLVEHAYDLVFILDPSGCIISLNIVGRKLTGYSLEEIAGKPFGDFLFDQGSGMMSAKKLNRGPGSFELALRTRDGKHIPVEVTMRPIYRNGAIVELQGIARDVSERRRIEEQLRQAQKMEAVGRLAGGIAHEFNNLLTVVAGAGHLLAERVGEDDESRELTSELLAASDQAAQLIQQLLTFGRKHTVSLKPVNLNRVVRGMENVLRRLSGDDLVLVLDLDENLELIEADAHQLNHLLLNLTTNARDATRGGGTLTIRTRNRDRQRIEMEVADTGSGMDETTKSRVFEPFFTTKEIGEGTGLGLAVVHGIVESFGGKIKVQSEPGKGAVFRMEFPIHRAR